MTMYTYNRLGSNGRLGNQLHQLAATMGIAHKEGVGVEFPLWEYRKWFSVPANLFVRHPTGKDTSDWATHLPAEQRPYLQDMRIWADISETIWSYFQASPAAERELRQRYPWFFDLGHTTAIHVRRGDYVTSQEYYRLHAMPYYSAALDLLPSNTTLLVFSDDIEWCRTYLPQKCRFVSPPKIPLRVPNQTDWMELFLMARSTRHVITNSSFSWWAAWLSNDPSPIAPADWHTSAWKDYDVRANLLPDHWTLL